MMHHLYFWYTYVEGGCVEGSKVKDQVDFCPIGCGGLASKLGVVQSP